MDQNSLRQLPGIYCPSLITYSRWLTREVNVGDVPVGAHHPIRIQSMTTTDTMNTIATVEQTIRMVEAGCEYVRITAPSIKEAHNLAEIKKELQKRGCRVPLVADIHFTPNAAEVAARIVEKVRVNPGNYADKKRFDQRDYTDAEYQDELERIFKKFSPLVAVCKEYGTAMRIGTNHGSLSDRIMSRYGDTPLGMVESAMEFIRICETLNYHQLVISMKSSNPQVMVQAYRLLVERMVAEGMNYPLHLGVTEAGDGEDGRIKSAAGIGALLEDGLGDTVRVSLTEEPEAEAPVAIALVERYVKRTEQVGLGETAIQTISDQSLACYNPFVYQKRATQEVNAFIGGHMVPRVVLDLSKENLKDPAVLKAAGYLYSPVLDKYNMADQSVDFVYLGQNLPSFNFPGNLKQVYDYTVWKKLASRALCHPLFSLEEYLAAQERDPALNLVRIRSSDLDTPAFADLPVDNTLVLVLETVAAHGMADQRTFFLNLVAMGIEVPVIIQRTYAGLSATRLQLYSATDLGALLVDGFGDGVWIDAPGMGAGLVTSTAFGILQATRSRISKTEYISCPSCGRTLFDLQETTQAIRSRTAHLKGLKIGIMGCIVNGPGEMADADYGYVGAGPGKITLYRGKEMVKKNVDTAEAINELIGIIRADGNWVEPEFLA
jgi:(E)-4-hydroxy-3-methylbut-2-enyl-diphosphate synthase